MSEHTVTRLPERILSKSADVKLLGDILADFNPDDYAQATTKYRKPSYQRGLNKSTVWNQSLVCSVLEGKAIGGVVMSKWEKAELNEQNEPTYTKYFNIEDGGTRLGALKKFYDGKFTTEYGDIENEDVRKVFCDYRVAVELLEKTNDSTRDSRYFKELCTNFSLLQEGTPLTASDRYAAWAADEEFKFEGSPIVNFTIEQVDQNNIYENCFGLKNIDPRGKGRKNLAKGVALISGMFFGPQYANAQYFLHVPILNATLSVDAKTKFFIVSNLIANVIKHIQIKLPRWSNERFTGIFQNTAKFTGAMIADIYDAYSNQIPQDDSFNTFANEYKERWTKLINTWRSQIQTQNRGKADEWLETVVYKDLDTANKRNSLAENLKRRMLAVRQWAQ